MSRPNLRISHALMIAAVSIVSAFAQTAVAEQIAGQAGAPHARPAPRDALLRSDQDLRLTPAQVRDVVAGRLALSGNTNLTVGKVAPKGVDLVAVEIVTASGSLVTTREISTKTGRPAGIERDTANPPPPGPRRRAMMDRSAGPRHMMSHVRDSKVWLGAGPGRDLNLTVDEARKLAEARLIMLGNDRLKVGPVKEKDADTIAVDIVTVDNALVMQREIDRHSGRSRMIRG